MRPMVQPSTREELLGLPAVVDLTTAAGVLGIGRTCAYELVRTGTWPTPVLRIGRLIRIPTAPLLELVGLERVPRKAS
jgi:predicted DNA-binding transcriptional regulator AlpA